MTRATLTRLVDVMRRCDPEYVASHSVEACTDDEWDDALAEAEELLDEPAPTRAGEMDDEDVAAQIVGWRE